MKHFLIAAAASATLIACGGDTVPLAAPRDVPVALSVSPTALNLVVGDVGRLTARAVDAKGLDVRASFAWSSADSGIATVGTPDGSVTAIAPGTTTVTATFGTLRATATVTVRLSDPPVGIDLGPPSLGLIQGGVDVLFARVYDATGRTVSTAIEWSSADPSIATVRDGSVTAISEGSTTVTAAFGAFRATANVSVVAVSGVFTFTRVTSLSVETAWTFTSNVLVFSVADRLTRSLRGTGDVTSIGAPAWSPDGVLLAVEGIHAFEDDHGLLANYYSDVYVLDTAATGDARWRALTANGLSTSPTWSPDGKRIAYVQRRVVWGDSGSVYVIDAAGGEPVRVTQTDGFYGAVRWSPDGTRLAFSAYLRDIGNTEIFVVNADGGGLTNVTRNAAADYDPSWSPDGTQLAFVSERTSAPGAYRRDVFVMDVDGNNARRLTSLVASQPAWAPDGQHIVFASDRALRVMTLAGTLSARMTTPPANSWDSAPVWRR